MIDSQAQIRWLAVAVALIVLVGGPALAGKAFGRSSTTEFDIRDWRGWDEETVLRQEAAVKSGRAIFLVSPGLGDEAAAGCPSTGTMVVKVPMRSDVLDTTAALETACSDLTASGERTVVLTQKPFSWPWAFATVIVLLIGTLVAIATLVGRQPRRPVAVVRDPAPRPSYRPPAPLVRDAAPPPPPRPAAPPVLLLADLPGVRDVVRELGATAKARSHVDGSGGYVALGDVLVWAMPMGSGVAFPDDDVHVTVSVTPTLDGGSRP